MTATIDFDVANFRQQFPAFANETTYPDAMLEAFWDNATCFISDSDYGRLNGDCRRLAIGYMAAHLLSTQQLIDNGETNLVLNNARIDNISVSVRPPPSANQWQWFLNSTPYGTQLFALLQIWSVGGLYVGSRYERSNFRKFDGGF